MPKRMILGGVPAVTGPLLTLGIVQGPLAAFVALEIAIVAHAAAICWALVVKDYGIDPPAANHRFRSAILVLNGLCLLTMGGLLIVMVATVSLSHLEPIPEPGR